MKQKYTRNNILLAFFLFIICAAIAKGIESNSASNISTYNDEQLPISTHDINKSLAAFDTILQVIKSPRCMNCHPMGDRPRQGDEQKIHLFNAHRGKEDKGTEVQKCATCHQTENNSYTNIPGAPHWQLAPKSMGWFGLSDLELGKVLVDTTLNGGRTAEELVNHMANDSLVLWAWNPGGDRKPPPIELDDFRVALNNWLKNGAYIPEK